MKLRTEAGNSTLMMVLLLFTFSTTLLNGLARQLTSQQTLVAEDVNFIKGYADALSAQAWGTQLQWREISSSWQCQEETIHHWRACLYQIDRNTVLLAAWRIVDTSLSQPVLWRWGEMQGNRMTGIPHGWLDFCPLPEASVCTLPR